MPRFEHFGINTYSYSQTHTAEACMDVLADQGFTAFELMLYPGHLWITDSQAVLRRIVAKATARKLEITNLNMANVDMNLTAAAPEMRDYTLGLWRQFLRIAGELGAQGIILGPGKPNPLFSLPYQAMEDHFFRALDVLLPQAEREGVTLWAENMPFAFLPRANQLLTALDKYGTARIGVCYDVANAHFIGEDPCDGLAQIGARLAHVHLSDTSTTTYKHDLVGTGSVDFKAIAAMLKAMKYGNRSFLEIITDDPGRHLPDSAERLINLGYP
jgi:sugar phosphate isomerase/epimerase